MTETIDLQPLRQSRDELEAALKEAGAVFVRGNAIKCPFHKDDTPSAGIFKGEDGAWRFKCHGCGFCEDIIGVRARAANRSVEDEIRAMRPDQEKEEKPSRVFPSINAMLDSIRSYSTVEAHYVYSNPDTTKPEMVVVRCRDGEGKKHFLQAKPVPDGFVIRAPAKPWPIYNRSRVRSSEIVIVCEGEKCVHIFHEAGYVATTSPGGAGKAQHADWTPLAGKRVYLWPDNDANGVKHMREVAEQLKNLKPVVEILWIDPETLALPEKGDVAEFMDVYGAGTKEQKKQAVQCILDIASPFGPSSAVQRLIDDTVSGKRFAVQWPWTGFGNLTNALLPGSITVFCGDPGSSKSFFLVQAARLWHRLGIKSVLYQLETDEEGSHLMRALAQESGCADLLEWTWVRDHAEEAKAIAQKYRAFTDSFGRMLITPPDKLPSMDGLTDWVRDQAKDGCRVIAIDPITAAETSDKRWDDDRRFVINCQKIMRDYGASLVLVTHPKLNAKDGKMADLAGGAGFSRFTHTVALIKVYHPAKDVRMKFPTGDKVLPVNRSVKIVKARLGRGGNVEIGYVFGNGLLFSEQGAIVKETKKEVADPFAS